MTLTLRRRRPAPRAAGVLLPAGHRGPARSARRLALLAAAVALGPGQAAGAASPPPSLVPPAEVEHLTTHIVAVYPHDPQAYTQGLLWDGEALLESTGLYGRSSLRRVALGSGRPTRSVPLASHLFAEGLAQVGDRLIQLTWREGLAITYDSYSLARTGQFTYDGEGWGLCFDGQRLVMSDGGPQLTFRDPDTFDVVGHLVVTLGGRPLRSLNELECVEGSIYANVWMQDFVVRIDPASGHVTAVIDASGLLSPEERQSAEVLNGIAYLPQRKSFLLTGKLWPKLFEVTFVPQAEGSKP